LTVPMGKDKSSSSDKKHKHRHSKKDERVETVVEDVKNEQSSSGKASTEVVADVKETVVASTKGVVAESRCLPPPPPQECHHHHHPCPPPLPSPECLVRVVNWGILKGEKGDKGERGKCGKDGKDGKNGHDGKRGKRGKDGKDAVLSFGYGSNDVQQFEVLPNAAVEFNNVYYPYLNTNINGNVLQVANCGVYQFQYSVRGVVIGNTEDPAPRPLMFGLVNNGNVINGSVNSIFGVPPSEPMPLVLNGTVIAEINEPLANIQLVNMTSNVVLYLNNDIPASNNAMISAIRLA